MTKKTTKRRRNHLPINYHGQHFMHNKKLIREIVEHADVGTGDTVLELGAGKGALTTVLSQKAGKVLAIEYDRKLVEIMKQKTSAHQNTKVIHQDIMSMRLPKEPFIVVSNIPYSITTSIMKKLLSNPASGFQRGVIVMEKGAAKRFTLTSIKDPYVIAWRMWFKIHYIQDISPANFSPPPKVMSAMVKITRREHPIVPYRDYLVFWGLADYMLRNPRFSLELALQGVFTPPQIKQLRRNLGLKNEIPVASLTEKHWGIIYETMIQHVPRFRWPRLTRRKLDQYFI